MECQCDGSWPEIISGLRARGSKRSSVEDLIDCLVLSIESEKLELRRCVNKCETSANAEARPSGLWPGGDISGLDVLFAAGVPPPFVGGLIVRP